MTEGVIEFESTKDKLLAETSTARWHDLQRFFAQGALLRVDQSLDLLDVAVLFAEDKADELEPLLDELKVSQPPNDLARSWYQENPLLWTVVVAPYVLVQYQRDIQPK